MKLFGRREQAHAALAAALSDLARLAEATPPLREAADLQGAILRAIYADPPRVGTLELAHAQAAAKLRAGTPLLRGEPAPLEIPAIQRLMLQLCTIMGERGSTPAAAAAIAAAVRGGSIQVGELAQAALDGRADLIRARAAALGLDGDMICTLLRFSLFPALERLAAQLAPLRAVDWGRGYCPTCGGWPLLGEQRGLDQARFLRCGLCATDWAVDRLLCPFCGSRDHADLSYLHVEGDEQQRAVTCERCHGYLKVLASLASIPPIELAIRDLATLHLDMIAIERGYAPPV